MHCTPTHALNTAKLGESPNSLDSPNYKTLTPQGFIPVNLSISLGE
jgi:hypothetical protein